MKNECKNLLIALTALSASALMLVWIIPAYVPGMPYDVGLEPSVMPSLASYLIMGMSIILIAQSVRANRNVFREILPEIGRQLSNVQNLKTTKNVLMILAICLAYYFLFNLIGFYLASLIIIPALAIAFGWRKWFSLVLTSIVVTTITHYCFTTFLNVSLKGWNPFLLL